MYLYYLKSRFEDILTVREVLHFSYYLYFSKKKVLSLKLLSKFEEMSFGEGCDEELIYAISLLMRLHMELGDIEKKDKLVLKLKEKFRNDNPQIEEINKRVWKERIKGTMLMNLMNIKIKNNDSVQTKLYYNFCYLKELILVKECGECSKFTNEYLEQQIGSVSDYVINFGNV